MKIRFKKKKLYSNLILGVLWLIIGVYNILEDEDLHWMDYSYLVIALLYLLHFIYDYKNQYLIIENESIRKNALYGNRKKIELNDINLITKTAGDYILKAENKQINIDPNLIEDESFIKLTNLLRKLNLPSDKNPFATTVETR